MRMVFLALVCLSSVASFAKKGDTIFRIEVGQDYKRHSNEDLRRRVWELERAVWQLQQEVFHLQGAATLSSQSASWTCYIQSFGETYTGTGTSEAAAKADALQKCSKGSSSIHCRESDLKCGK